MQFRPELSFLRSYVPGTSIEEVKKMYALSDVIKLASNENPFGCPVSSGDFAEVLLSASVYPNQDISLLKQALQKKYSLSSNQIILGNGSDELLYLLSQAFIAPQDQVISTQHGFSVYETVTLLMGGVFTACPMKHYHIDLTEILNQISSKTKIIFLTTPNNPTGLVLSREALHGFLSQVPSHVVVVLDEAYIEFADDSSQIDGISLIQEFKNLIVLKTFSKAYGLAGFRLGYGIAQSELIHVLQKVRPPFNVNSLALYAGHLALNRTDFLQKTIQHNQEQKLYLYQELDALKLTYLKTQANFIFIQVPKPAKEIYTQLIQKGIIIRPLDSFGFSDAIRVSIGLFRDNQRFVKALKEIL